MNQAARTEFLELLALFYLRIPCSETSGVRTPAHNRDIGGATDSAHVHGVAQDVILDAEVNPDAAIYHAKRLGFYGIEWDERNRHLHLDKHPSQRHWWVKIGLDGVSIPLSLHVTDV